MNLPEACRKLQDCIMAVFDRVEDEEYRRTLWMTIFSTMEKYKFVVSAVTVVRPLAPAKTEKPEPTLVEELEETPQEEAEEPAMPFGKYGGTPVSQLPPDYVLWAVLNIKFTQERFRPVEEALKARAEALRTANKNRRNGSVPY